MKALIVPNLDIITKEQLIIELEADGVTITDASIPEIIWVEMESRDVFDKWLKSEKVAGANSEEYEKKLRFKEQGTATIDPNTSWTNNASHHNWGLAQMTQSSTTLSTNFTYSNTGANVDCVIMDQNLPFWIIERRAWIKCKRFGDVVDYIPVRRVVDAESVRTLWGRRWTHPCRWGGGCGRQPWKRPET